MVRKHCNDAARSHTGNCGIVGVVPDAARAYAANVMTRSEGVLLSVETAISYWSQLRSSNMSNRVSNRVMRLIVLVLLTGTCTAQTGTPYSPYSTDLVGILMILVVAGLIATAVYDTIIDNRKARAIDNNPRYNIDDSPYLRVDEEQRRDAILHGDVAHADGTPVVCDNCNCKGE